MLKLREKNMNFFSIKIILLSITGITIIHSFSMNKEKASKPFVGIAYNNLLSHKEMYSKIKVLTEFSKINTSLIYEAELHATTKQEITEFENVTRTFIEEIEKDPYVEIFFDTLPQIFKAINSFVADLKEKSSKESNIKPYLDRYNSILSRLTVDTNETFFTSEGLTKDIFNNN